ncbi:hypothetical protein PGB34_14725 [Xenophilus arseniciresistens]|uniref:Uncharacterized protein n=1 Tax=Xenophilus arseniciresistens TaxID=1283306 RepID=A0AAE3NDH3_9BURK|nr:hypothetical protein [Xenophilus arseniciresistens]MDA7417614.1 hypothetical protein [Xenophilus arseniciresistens]
MIRSFLHIWAAAAALFAAQAVWSQGAPGSDPIVLQGRVSYLELPTAAPARSKEIDRAITMPPRIQAKVNRYEAKAFAALEGADGTLHSGQDVISTSSGNALERNCTQSLASTSAPAGAGPSGRYGVGGAADQVVVLRGDLVNICR